MHKILRLRVKKINIVKNTSEDIQQKQLIGLSENFQPPE